MTKYVRKSKPRRKSAPRRRRAVGGPSRVPHLPGTLAPTHLITQLKYVNTLQKQTPVGGGPAQYNQWRLNSIWDPDFTSVAGTSALGLAEWSKLYQRYRVFKCDYKITLNNITEDTVVAGAVVPQNYNDAFISMSDMMRPMARRFELGNKSGQNRAVIKGSISIPKLVGLTSAQYKAEESAVSGFAANPMQLALLSVVVQSSSGAQAFIAGQIELTYHVEMMSIQANSEALDVTTGLPIVPVFSVCT